MATVGYLEGTDSTILTRLAVSGIDTLPLSNGVDGHGKYVNHLSKGEVDVVVGYAHKLTPRCWYYHLPQGHALYL